MSIFGVGWEREGAWGMEGDEEEEGWVVPVSNTNHVLWSILKHSVAVTKFHVSRSPHFTITQMSAFDSTGHCRVAVCLFAARADQN